MSGAEALIPIVLFAGGFAMVFGIVYLKTRENMAMIERGMNPKRNANLPAPFRSLKAGLVLLGAGLGLLAAFFISRGAFGHDDEAIYFALIAIGGGLGLLGSYGLERKEWERNREFYLNQQSAEKRTARSNEPVA